MGDVHPYGNPHYWTDPSNGKVIARAIAGKLAELDPAGKADYDKNLAAFESKLDAKSKEWDAKMAPYAGTKVVTFHDSWPNFAKPLPSDGGGPRRAEARDSADALPHARDHQPDPERQDPAHLVEPYFDRKTPDAIAAKTGRRS
jgi:ABC-type Zn uptake system ZnuABC Zn-binding protein ZnuA